MKISPVYHYNYYKGTFSLDHGRSTFNNIMDLSKKLDEHNEKLDKFCEILKTKIKKE